MKKLRARLCRGGPQCLLPIPSGGSAHLTDGIARLALTVAGPHVCIYALNEVELTGWTYAALKSVGRRLGERDGTGPDDHPFLRSFRDESRAEGKVEGRAEGRAETVREMLRLRGIAVSEGFPANVPGFAEAPEEVAVSAGLACDSEEDFHARIRGG